MSCSSCYVVQLVIACFNCSVSLKARHALIPLGSYLFPTQAACIPAALEGKDIVARARTGSGKTLAYLLPALHKVLSMPRDRQRAGWQALVLVPTRELCEQASPLCLSTFSVRGIYFAIPVLLLSVLSGCRTCVKQYVAGMLFTLLSQRVMP